MCAGNRDVAGGERLGLAKGDLHLVDTQPGHVGVPAGREQSQSIALGHQRWGDLRAPAHRGGHDRHGLRDSEQRRAGRHRAHGIGEDGAILITIVAGDRRERVGVGGGAGDVGISLPAVAAHLPLHGGSRLAARRGRERRRVAGGNSLIARVASSPPAPCSPSRWPRRWSPTPRCW